MTVSQKEFVTADVNNDDYKNIHLYLLMPCQNKHRLHAAE